MCIRDSNDCNNITCSGNGQCVDGVDSFTCTCNTGFVGELCETNINDCAGIMCSGNGQCVDGVNSFTCVCNSGFVGNLCEVEIRGEIDLLSAHYCVQGNINLFVSPFPS